MTRPIRVAIIDDHRVVRSGLAVDLRTDPPEFEVVASVESVEDFDALTGLPPPDVVIVDLTLRGQLSGVAAVEHVARTHPVLVFTQERNHERLLAARVAGAAVCLGKDVDAAVLRTMVASVARGEVVLGQSEAAAVRRVHARTPEVELSATEEQVLEYIVDGLSNKDICSRMRITPKTLGTHITNIYGVLRAVHVLPPDAHPSDRQKVVTAGREHRFRTVLRLPRRRPR
jgi:two-component system, NarL family, response regulator LiaR